MNLLSRVFLVLCFQSIFVTSISSSSSLSADPSAIPKYFLEFAKNEGVSNWMVGTRRRLYENPELGFEGLETSKVIRDELDKLGVSYKYPVAVSGIIGFIGTGRPPFVALRAVMDSLPIQDKSEVPGKIQACRHDAHVAMQLGAARILQEHSHEIQGTVVLVFEPAGDDGCQGARRMIEEGAVENVEAIFGAYTDFDTPVGQVSTRSGPMLAGHGNFEATIYGEGGHGAIPHHAVDPIVAASTVIISLQNLVSREADPLDTQVVTVSKFKGGSAFNVIPDSVTIGGTYQALLRESFQYLKKRIKEVITSQAAVHRCKATIDFLDDKYFSAPPTINDDSLHKHFTKVASDMIGVDNVKDIEPQIIVAEDFAFYQEVVPGYYYLLGFNNDISTIGNEEVLPYGASLQASLAVRYLLEKKITAAPTRNSKNHDEL